MSRRDASELASRLGQRAEAVCRHFLSNGCRQGGYWLVGNVHNEPGGSLFVRLEGPDSGKGAAGKWTDAATGEHGDLLDVIGQSLGLTDFKEIADEARCFLSLRPSTPNQGDHRRRSTSRRPNSTEAARRLLSMSRPILQTLAETYLRDRGITALHETTSLRFHPHCFYRPDQLAPVEVWPAMIAAVADLTGKVVGAHRTWLDPAGFSNGHLGRAPIGTPRRAMGQLLGHAVRFGACCDILAAGEGIETMLSQRVALPSLPAIAALSAGHLSAILFPHTLRRLYIARDNDPAGLRAASTLIERAGSAGIEAIVLTPRLGDFNEDLRLLGAAALQAILRAQLVPEDVARVMAIRAGPEGK